MFKMKRNLKNLLLVALGEFLGPLLGFFVIAYLARVLGVANFGRINFAQAVFSYGLLLNYLGLPTLGTREIARQQNPEKIVPVILSLRLILSLFGFVLISLISLALPKGIETKTLIVLYGFSLFTTGLFLDWFFQGKEAMEYLAISRILNYTVYLLFVLLTIHNQNDFYFVPIGFFLGNLTIALFQFLVYEKRFGKIRLTLNWQDSRRLLKMALPLGIASLFIQFGQYFTPTLLGLIKGNQAVGYFAAAYKLVMMIAIFDRVFTIVALPMITRFYTLNNPNLLQQLHNRLQKFLIFGVLPILIGGVILAKDIILLVYGTNYWQTVILFQILIFFFGITIFVSLYGVSLIAAQKEFQYAKAIGFGTLTNILFNPFLTFYLGALGASITVVLAEAVTLTFALINYHRIGGIIGFGRLKQILPKSLFATCLMAFFLLLFSNSNLFLRMVGAFIIYGGLLFLVRGITQDDFRLSTL